VCAVGIFHLPGSPETPQLPHFGVLSKANQAGKQLPNKSGLHATLEARTILAVAFWFLLLLVAFCHLMLPLLLLWLLLPTRV